MWATPVQRGNEWGGVAGAGAAAVVNPPQQQQQWFSRDDVLRQLAVLGYTVRMKVEGGCLGGVVVFEIHGLRRVCSVQRLWMRAREDVR